MLSTGDFILDIRTYLEKRHHVNGNQKTAGVVILISNKIDFTLTISIQQSTGSPSQSNQARKRNKGSKTGKKK